MGLKSEQVKQWMSWIRMPSRVEENSWTSELLHDQNRSSEISKPCGKYGGDWNRISTDLIHRLTLTLRLLMKQTGSSLMCKTCSQRWTSEHHQYVLKDTCSHTKTHTHTSQMGQSSLEVTIVFFPPLRQILLIQPHRDGLLPVRVGRHGNKDSTGKKREETDDRRQVTGERSFPFFCLFWFLKRFQI